MGLLFVITLGLVVLFSILIMLNIRSNGKMVYVYIIAMGVCVVIFLGYPSTLRERQSYKEFENWARVNQIHYVDGYTNLKASEKKIYESLLGHEIQYREVLVED